MARGHEILINGKVLDPRRAARELLPLDTTLRCPACDNDKVGTREPRTGHQFVGELKAFVPRQQDRWCFACGHQWTAVLPPEAIASQPIITTGVRR